MGSEVLIVVHEVGLVLLVDELTSLLYILGHSWRATAEHPDLPYLSSVGGERGRGCRGETCGLEMLTPQELLPKPDWTDQGIDPRC